MVAYILAGILGVLFLAEKIRSRKQYLLFETILKKLTDGEPLDGDGLGGKYRGTFGTGKTLGK